MYFLWCYFTDEYNVDFVLHFSENFGSYLVIFKFLKIAESSVFIFSKLFD